MPVDWNLYPENWRDFSWWVRHVRAQGRCECTGQCGLHQPNPRTRRCDERHHTPAHWARGIVKLTTAHLCDCNPLCTIPTHVIAACQRCHLRIDRFKHAQTRRQRTRYLPDPAPPETPSGAPKPPQDEPDHATPRHTNPTQTLGH